MKPMAVLLATVALILGASHSNAHEHGVVTLTEQNFEHATQAASGQTTGFWLVYFGKENDGPDQIAWQTYAEQQREAQPWMVHAFVNVDENPKLVERFKINHTPTFLLFRNQKMYRMYSEYTSSITAKVVSALADFSDKGWRKAREESVPRDAQLSLDFSTTTVWAMFVGLALVAFLVAGLSGSVSRYLSNVKPLTGQAGHPKRQ